MANGLSGASKRKKGNQHPYRNHRDAGMGKGLLHGTGGIKKAYRGLEGNGITLHQGQRSRQA